MGFSRPGISAMLSCHNQAIATVNPVVARRRASVRPTGMMLAGSMAMKTNALSPIEKLLELYYKPLFRFAARLCGSPVRAMILTQRTFRLALDRSRGLPVPANVRAWLFAILFHTFLEERPRIRRA